MFWDILGCFGKFWDNCCLIGVVREDFELPNVDFLWNFSVRGLIPPPPPYFRELRTFWDTFDFGHKKGEKTKLHKTSKMTKYSYIGYGKGV